MINADQPLTNGARLSSRSLLIAGSVFSLAAVAALPADIPVASFCLRGGVPDDLRKLFDLSEVFAHGFGIAMIVLVVFVLDVRRRRQVPRLLACVLLPGLVNLLLKQTVARFRPTQFVQGQAISLPESAWDTFAGWTAALPPDGFEHAPNHVLQSFGSGHTAVAVGLAIGLTWMYPRGGWVFFLVAALAAAQRIDSGAHFVSDTLVAAAIACFAGALCLYPIPFGMLWNPVALGNGSTKSHSPDREGRGAMEINEEA